MAFRVRALASGSSGNSLLVRHCGAGEHTAFLIDAGLSVVQLTKFLALENITPNQLSGIVITHEHDDHIRGACAFSRKFNIPLIANSATLHRVFMGRDDTQCHVLATGSKHRVGSLTVETFPVNHDAIEPVGINVYCDELGERHKASIMTDVGCITDYVRRAVAGADLLVCESNYDLHRLKTGPYPEGIKRRIISPTGHLSNEDAVAFMTEHLVSKGPCTLWLAHLSKTNNMPKLAFNYANATLKLATRRPFVLDIAQRDKPSASWEPGQRALQLNLF